MAARKTVPEIPEMPILHPSLLPVRKWHEESDDLKRISRGNLQYAMVAQLVKDKATLKSDECQKALRKEWDNLLSRKCWDINKAEKWKVVKARADKAGETIHLGSLLELVYEKHSELDPGKRQLKGRVVFLGNQVKDQHGASAVFEEMASAPAGMEASRYCDAWGCYEGHTTQQADAEQAYTQAFLGGKIKTWIKVPIWQRNPEWNDNELYVVPLEKALYGHPRSGADWELKCETAIKALDFTPVGDGLEWRSCFYHKELKLMLMVYVDDFKLSGPTEAVTAMWQKFKELPKDIRIELGPPENLGQFLGCMHEKVEKW